MIQFPPREPSSSTSSEARAIAVVLLRITQLTEDIFGKLLTIESRCDPSEPDDPWVVFNVPFAGPYADSREKRDAWYAGVRKIVPESFSDFCLCLLPPL